MIENPESKMPPRRQAGMRLEPAIQVAVDVADKSWFVVAVHQTDDFEPGQVISEEQFVEFARAGNRVVLN